MFTEEKTYISEIKSVVFVDAYKHPEKKTVFKRNTPFLRYELIYKISGETFTTFNDKTLHTVPGCIYLLPKCENAVYFVDRIKNGECIDIIFDTDYPLSKEAMLLCSQSNMKLVSLFESICRIWMTKKEGYYYKCMAIFYEILGEIQKSEAGYLPDHKYKLIEKGVDYLHNHIYDTEDINLTELASMCGISYSYFKRLFTEKHGVPPVQYINRLRLDRAKELLAANRYSVNEVAGMCGFKNVYYFSRIFKKHTGLSPTKYS